ncbi:MAG TPA: hypothetical protein VFH92_07805 [Phenylobacterium sp.]|nr:hypothetical protein [Phenylobacterium sp.]
MDVFTGLMVALALLVLNAPVVLVLWRLARVADLKQVLREKGGIGDGDTTSYSRLTGLAGATVLTAFYWAIGNLVIWKAFTQVGDIRPIVNAVQPIFLIGSALFLPYAFNQLKAAFAVAGVAKAAATAAGAVAVSNVQAAAGQGAAVTSLLVVNLSSAIDDARFAAAVSAIGVQVNRDFRPAWGAGATLTPLRQALNGAPANIDGAAHAIVYVGDQASDPTLGVEGAFGYHARNFGELPYAFVYLDVCSQYGEDWSCTLSHEILELLADPTTALSVDGPAPSGVGQPGQRVRYSLEVCDPTQGDHYEIDQVKVANFVTRGYFGMAGAGAATNFLNLALPPFGVRPHGYIQYEDSAGAATVNGPAVEPARIAARKILGAHRRNARRAAGLARYA